MSKEKGSQPKQNESNPGAPDSLDQALETPQAAPAVGRGPDSHSLPRSIEPQVGDNWEARYKGLDARYQKDREDWTRQLEDLRTQVQQLSQPKEPKAPAPKPQAKKEPESKPDPADISTLNVLDQAIQQRKAASFRDMMVEDMSRELGIPALEMFTDDIPIRPPTRNEYGTVNDSAQRAAIQAFADKLKGVQGETSQRTQAAIREGMTPGASPGAPPATGSDVYEEFLELMEVYGSAEFDELSPTDQNRIQKRYFELTNDKTVQDRHEGETSPTMSWKDLTNDVRDALKRLSRLESSRGSTPYGNMA